MRAPWPAPATIGLPVDEIDTPALVVDLDILERNLKRMASFAVEHRVRLRPHAKMHKCVALAKRQIALGAVGVCVQKASEAQAMLEGGIGDVLITNQVVGAAKLARLAHLARLGRLGVCVDHADNLSDLSAAMEAAGANIDVYVELDVGAGRCGVAPAPAPAEAALSLARAAVKLPGLNFMGLHAYHGGAQHLRSEAERRAATNAAVNHARLTRDMLLAHGLPCPIITGAGSGTYALEGASGVYNELQPGSYAFMDADYARNQADTPFEHALTIASTVMSVRESHVVLDCGLKAHSVDSGMPVVASPAGLRYVKASDEHGIVQSAGGALPSLGARVHLIPGHIDPTVNLHDWIIAVRAGRVEEIWPVDARGAMW